MNIKNEKVEQLADELPHLTCESKTAAILRARWKRARKELLGEVRPENRDWRRPSISWRTRSGRISHENFWVGP
jgi:hypothetical protein